MPGLGFRPLFGYPNKCDGISRCWWSVVNSPNVDKGITTLAININFNSCMENLSKNFSKEHCNNSNQDKKTAGRMSCLKEKNLLTNFHVSKKGKTPDKKLCVNNIQNRKIKLLKICHASVKYQSTVKYSDGEFAEIVNGL